ncbi:hypothetical protein TeGR_g4727, partial [Tetraparma gracilis]
GGDPYVEKEVFLLYFEDAGPAALARLARYAAALERGGKAPAVSRGERRRAVERLVGQADEALGKLAGMVERGREREAFSPGREIGRSPGREPDAGKAGASAAAKGGSDDLPDKRDPPPSPPPKPPPAAFAKVVSEDLLDVRSPPASPPPAPPPAAFAAVVSEDLLDVRSPPPSPPPAPPPPPPKRSSTTPLSHERVSSSPFAASFRTAIAELHEPRCGAVRASFDGSAFLRRRRGVPALLRRSVSSLPSPPPPPTPLSGFLSKLCSRRFFARYSLTASPQSILSFVGSMISRSPYLLSGADARLASRCADAGLGLSIVALLCAEAAEPPDPALAYRAIEEREFGLAAALLGGEGRGEVLGGAWERLARAGVGLEEREGIRLLGRLTECVKDR